MLTAVAPLAFGGMPFLREMYVPSVQARSHAQLIFATARWAGSYQLFLKTSLSVFRI